MDTRTGPVLESSLRPTQGEAVGGMMHSVTMCVQPVLSGVVVSPANRVGAPTLRISTARLRGSDHLLVTYPVFHFACGERLSLHHAASKTERFSRARNER